MSSKLSTEIPDTCHISASISLAWKTFTIRPGNLIVLSQKSLGCIYFHKFVAAVKAISVI
ncbi:MAG: hypothetical protein WBL68_19010 [Nitrososphaeraceae archaeon]